MRASERARIGHAIAATVEKRLDDGIEWAKEQRSPTADEALEHVYVDSIGGKALL